MENKTDDAESNSEYSDFGNTDESFDQIESGRKYSFVWKYFHQIKNSKSFECIICNGCVGHQTSNLARHLSFTHNIKNHTDTVNNSSGKRGRPSKSFIWKFCTKQDKKHALCNLCNKVLYFGGGNTENIAKHLRRKHSSYIEADGVGRENMSESMETSDVASANADHSNTSGLNVKEDDKRYKTNYDINARKERKGGSYVWNYCDKISRHTIRCNLCNKVMSFHGTANVITHLQRKHNIVGKLDGELPAENSVPDLSFADAETLQQQLAEQKIRQYKRSPSTASVVWKYCKRVGRDVVRCGFCKKNLSYQGTSNLQRHLHRMHGVVTQGRISKDSDPDDIRWKKFNSNSIWEHCSLIDGDDEKTKCNLCNAVFNSKDIDIISKHLGGTHGIASKTNSRKKSRRRSVSDEDTSSSENVDFDDDWGKNDYSNDGYNNTVEVTNNIKRNDTFFDEIIEEDPENTKYDEEPFDPNTLHELPLVNPLSPHSSRRSTPIPEYKPPSLNNYDKKRLQSLNEEKIRVETEYFREKAGYYRMQKYLTALQAKKTRLELEQLCNAPLNGSVVANGEYITNMPVTGSITTL